MTTSHIRVRGVEEMIATVPLQMGYQPEDSLVLVLLGPPERRPDSARPVGDLRMVARLDLPHDIGGYEELLARVGLLLRQQRPAVIEALAFEDDTDATGVLRAVVRVCEQEEVDIHHVVRVREGSWQELEPDGTASVWRVVPSIDQVPCAADLVLAGAHIGPGRAELAEWIRQGDTERKLQLMAEMEDYLDRFLRAAPDTLTDPDGSRAADDPEAEQDLARLQLRFMERGALAWRRILDTTTGGPEVVDLPPAVLAQALVMLWHREFRDGVITWVAPGAMSPGMLPREVTDALVRHLELARLGNRALLDRLVALCALVPDEFAPPLLTVTGQAAWALNSGTVANLAIERALELEPRYYLAQLTDRLLQNAVRPPPGPFSAVAS